MKQKSKKILVYSQLGILLLVGMMFCIPPVSGAWWNGIYNSTLNVTTSLRLPLNNTNISVSTIFQSNATMNGGTIKNATLYIWNKSSYERFVNTSGLVAWWDLDGNANDNLGKYNGTLQNGAYITTEGKIGGAGVFDGVNDFMNTSLNTDTIMPINNTWSFNIWLNTKLAISGTYAIPLRFSNGSANGGAGSALFIHQDGTVGNFNIVLRNTTNSLTYYGGAGSIQNNVWYMITGTWNGTSFRYYWNGSLLGGGDNTFIGFGKPGIYVGSGKGGTYFNGSIDDVRIYNRTLSADEIYQLYETTSIDKIPITSGTGTSAVFNWSKVLTDGNYYWNVWTEDTTKVYGSWATSSFINTVLNLFPNSVSYNTTTVETSLEGYLFNGTINATKYPSPTASFIYNGTAYPSTATLYGNDLILTNSRLIPIIVGSNIRNYTTYATYNSSSGSFSDVENAYDANWTTYADSTDATANYIYFNYTKPQFLYSATLEVRDHTRTNITLPATCLVGEQIMIRVNIETDPRTVWGCWRNATSDWETIKSQTADDKVYEQQMHFQVYDTKDFYWSINLNATTQVNTSSYSQAVMLVPTMSFNSTCSAGLTPVMNFTFADELTRGVLTNVSVKLNFQYGLTNQTVVTVNQSFTNISQISLCIDTTSSPSYSINYGEIEYTKTDYSIRRYYVFENTRVSNNTIVTPLYLLPSASSTSFLIEIRSPSLTPYTDKYTTLLRWYTELNEYKVVEMGRTDDKGQTVNKVQIEDADYRIGVYHKNGTLIHLINPIRMVCLTSPCSYTINVPSAITSIFDEVSGIQTDLTWNNGTFTLTYSDPSQNTDIMHLRVYKIGGISETLVCESNGTAFTGVLTCDVSSEDGVLKAVAVREASPERIIALLIIDTLTTIFQGTFGLFLQFLIVVTLAFLGIISPVVTIIMGVLALLFGVLVFKTVTYPILIGVAVLGGIVIHWMRRST